MKKKILFLAGVITCLAFLHWNQYAAQAAKSSTSTTSYTSQSIKEKQDQIDKTEKERNNLKKNLSDVQSIKKNLESKKNDLAKYIEELDLQLAEIEEKVNDLKGQILVKEAEITDAENQLETAITREENQMESMITRAKLMYEKKDSFAASLLNQSSGFGDLLNRAEFMEKLVTYDKEQWTEFQDIRRYVQLCKKQLELENEILGQMKENAQLEQNTLELFMEQKQKDIEAYESDISNQEKAIREYEDMIAQQDELIKALEKAIEEERKRLAVKRTYDGGVFKFPLASYTRISDEYGWRTHPILKVKQFHNGVDLAAPKGTAIYAAYDGVVVAADYSSTMGNYVMIDHGDNLYTIYMHASSLKVKKDAVVKRGDTIALVGSTGRSTGNHLHFGVRRNGEYVSPWDYITP